MPDLGAELIGYRNELTRVRDDEHASEVRAEIARVSGALRRQAAQLAAHADEFDAAGQDVPAAHARVEARRLRDLAGDAPASNDAASTLPHDNAATRKRERQ